MYFKSFWKKYLIFIIYFIILTPFIFLQSGSIFAHILRTKRTKFKAERWFHYSYGEDANRPIYDDANSEGGFGESTLKRRLLSGTRLSSTEKPKGGTIRGSLKDRDTWLDTRLKRPDREEGIPDHNPAVTSDGAGNVYLVWEHGNELWWGINREGRWDGFGKIPGAGGARPVVLYDRELLDHGGSGSLFCTWESIKSPTRIISSVGELTDKGVTWSEPQSITKDDYDDSGIALTVDNDHNPLVLWLQSDSSKEQLLWLQRDSSGEQEDDVDLYYQVITDLTDNDSAAIDLTGPTLTNIGLNQMDLDEDLTEDVIPSSESKTCLEHWFIKRANRFPGIVPVLGGKFDLKFRGIWCASPGFPGITLLPETDANLSVNSTLSPFLSARYQLRLTIGNHIQTSFSPFVVLQATVVPDAIEGIADPNKENYKGGITKETLQLGASSYLAYDCFPMPLFIGLVPIGTVRVGPLITSKAYISLVHRPGISSRQDVGGIFKIDRPEEDASWVWKYNLPSGAPDEVSFTVNMGIGGEGRINAFGGKIMGRSWIAGGLEAKYTIPPFFSRVEEKLFITLHGRVRFGGTWNGVRQVFDKTYKFPVNDPDYSALNAPLQRSIISSWKNRLQVDKMDGLRLMGGNVSVREKFELEKKPFIGTGSVYEGKTVLNDITSDVYDDGLPAAARSESGEIIVVWDKGFASSCLGSKVYAANYNENGWSSPVEITPDINFYKDTAVSFDSYSQPMAVWSSASNDGLDYEKSSAAEIIEAMDKADLVYSHRVNGKWTTPKTLAMLPGCDEQVSLAGGFDGKITAVWINQSKGTSAIFSSFWDGKNWTEPALIAKSALAESPRVVYTLGQPMVIWAQDKDGNIDTFEDWTLYSSLWDGASWPSPAPLSY